MELKKNEGLGATLSFLGIKIGTVALECHLPAEKPARLQEMEGEVVVQEKRTALADWHFYHTHPKSFRR